MPAKMACLTGATVYQLLENGQLSARPLGPRATPFGDSEEVFLVEQEPAPFLLLPRYGTGRTFLNPARINYRANLYALKDLGAEMVVSWTAAGAISHDLNLGQIVVPDDLIDQTRNRPRTFFEDSGFGLLRQFPVFCPAMRKALGDVLANMWVPYQTSGTVAVTEGPRLETPAEVRMLANAGAQLVAHTLAPDFALARELELCLTGVCYVVNYAETGSRHVPLTTGSLFGGLTEAPPADRIRQVSEALPALLRRLLERLEEIEADCECRRTMRPQVEAGLLDADWHRWFDRAPSR